MCGRRVLTMLLCLLLPSAVVSLRLLAVRGVENRQLVVQLHLESLAQRRLSRPQQDAAHQRGTSVLCLLRG